MARHHAIIVIRGRDQDRRVLLRWIDVVQRRIRAQHFEVLWLIGRSVVADHRPLVERFPSDSVTV
jgi:hypothetical protein